MIPIQRNPHLFQQAWIGKGERGLRDFILIPAIFFGGLSPGLFISSLIHNYVPGYWIALIVNFFGYGITHLFFLGKMERFWRALLNLRTSWISRGFFFCIMFNFFGLLYAVSVTVSIDFLSDPVVRMALKTASAVSAVLFAAYPGFLLLSVKAIPFWRSPMVPVLFFLLGEMGGTAFQIVLMHFIPAGSDIMYPLITKKLFFTMAIFILLIAVLMIKSRHGGAEKASVDFLLKGEFSVLFLLGGVALGLIVPIILLTAGIVAGLDFAQYSFIYYIAMILGLAGIYIGKYSILRAGAYSPMKK